MSLESAYNTIEKLVNDFKNNERHYLSSDYSESQARLDFIDKLFIALGWDVNHEHQKNPYEQEVKVERRVKDKEAQKRADYAFFLEPNYRDPKFYVEAKKPSRSLDNPYDYFQAIRYGWNAQTPLVVLTDFEEFHILDSRFKPDIKYTKERKVLSFHYSDYLDREKFSKLYYLFSREAVGTGSIEKFSETMPKPRGKAVQKGLFPGSYQSIDESFLTELDEIRNTLARSFKKKNPALTSEELTEATQRTIDRLVFIRFLEDMLIEGEHHISSYGDKGTAWGDFIADCRSLNAKYNGIVFKEHFIDRLPLNKGELREQSGIQRGSNTAISPDDKDFADICEELSHVNSPYNFNSIPIHILGSIYERFLGKVVHATDKRVTIEEKPEVRKAGGVYYTPQYIVQYIVNNTVGKLIEGKTPTEIAKLRFADISCGSGSFLITVYDTLLRYHSRYYQEHEKEAKAEGCIFSNGLWVLSLKQKRQILLNNVYGVDIDHQAVEVTQLSLYLKLLEDETLATANEMQALFKEKILPDLSKNIICGNSLIGNDIFDGNMFPGDEERKINAMNFEDAFPSIMKNGGFDAIVGNPPYVDSEEMVKSQPIAREYCSKYYHTAKGNWDMYCVMCERAISKLNKSGKFGFIIPNKFLSAPYGEHLKKYFNENKVEEILDYSNVPVFVSNGKKINVYPVIILVGKSSNDRKGLYKKMESSNSIDLIYSKIFELKKNDVDWTAKFDVLEDILTKIDDVSTSIETNFNVNSAATVSEAYLIKEILEDKESFDEKYFKFVNTGTIDRYANLWGLQKTTYIKDAYNYPVINKNKLKKLSNKRFTQSECEKLIFAGMVKNLEVIYDSGEYLAGKSTAIVTLKNAQYSLKYLLGILNSKLLSRIFVSKNKFIAMAGGYINVNQNQIVTLPCKSINFNDKTESAYHDKMVELVDSMNESKYRYYIATTDKDKNFYESKCNSLDRQIDRLVYELYGLTEEEIKIVERE